VWDNPTVHFTSGATTALNRGSGVCSHHAEYSPLPLARSLNFDELPASTGNSVLSFSQSQSTQSAKRHAAEDAGDSALRKPARRKKVAHGPKDDEDDDDNDKETDVIPTTDRATVKDTSTVEERRAKEQRATALIKANHNNFFH
jgi:hypothetical protein